MQSPADPIDNDLEASLWHAFKVEGSTTARERLFSIYAAFAKSIANRHHHERTYGDLDIADMRQLAYEGLLEALDRFDPARSVPFRAFASHRISGSILDGLSKMTEMRQQVSWRQRVRRERLQSLSVEGADALSTSEAMAALADLAVGLALGFMLEGTGMVLPSEDVPAADHRTSPTAYEGAAWKELVERLKAELSALPERERTILYHHYIEGIAFDHVASLLQISKARVSQLHRGALDLLRKRMLARGHFRLER